MKTMASIRTLLLCALAVALCGPLHAQAVSTIQISLRDGKTGLPAEAVNFMVRIDHHDTVHNEWVRIGDDGVVTVTLPADAKLVAVKATYDLGMETYINCDAAKETDKERDFWYPVSQILATGLVASNECSKTQYTASPGEFVFFVRKRTWREQEN